MRGALRKCVSRNVFIFTQVMRITVVENPLENLEGLIQTFNLEKFEIFILLYVGVSKKPTKNLEEVKIFSSHITSEGTQSLKRNIFSCMLSQICQYRCNEFRINLMRRAYHWEIARISALRSVHRWLRAAFNPSVTFFLHRDLGSKDDRTTSLHEQGSLTGLFYKLT